jgi:hypothetical protein
MRVSVLMAMPVPIVKTMWTVALTIPVMTVLRAKMFWLLVLDLRVENVP